MSRIYGMVTGQVVKVDDRDGEGKVQVSIPRLGGNNTLYPAPVATLMSGGGRGAWLMPEEGDEVLIAFDQGDVNHPYIVGFLWNGEQKPPETDRHKRVLHSVNGHKIVIYDPPDIIGGDQGYVEISDANHNLIRLENGDITLQSAGTILIQAPNVIINGRPVSLAPRPI